MQRDQLIAEFPTLYHMADAGSWESVQKHGLLSTSALLDLFELNGKRRDSIESCHRPECVTIEHPTFGTAVIRDQKPMSESALRKCLRGMTPPEWYRTLNRRVFFWLTRERLMGLLAARAYRDRKHCVLTLDTAQLLDRHEARVTLSPINSGSTVYNPRSRGKDTFLSISGYPFGEWSKKRGKKKAIAELAVDYAIKNISEVVVRVEWRLGGKVLRVLWER
jgi:hypothetical protein